MREKEQTLIKDKREETKLSSDKLLITVYKIFGNTVTKIDSLMNLENRSIRDIKEALLLADCGIAEIEALNCDFCNSMIYMLKEFIKRTKNEMEASKAHQSL